MRTVLKGILGAIAGALVGLCAGLILCFFTCDCDVISRGVSKLPKGTYDITWIVCIITGVIIGIIIGFKEDKNKQRIKQEEKMRIERERKEEEERIERERKAEEERIEKERKAAALAELNNKKENIRKTVNKLIDEQVRSREYNFDKLNYYINKEVEDEFKYIANEEKMKFENSVLSSAKALLKNGTKNSVLGAEGNLVFLVKFNPDYPQYADWNRKVNSIKNRIWASNGYIMSSKYGIPNTNLVEKIKAFSKAKTDFAIDNISSRLTADGLLSSGTNMSIIDELVEYIWYYAMQKPHDAVRFGKAIAAYQHFARVEYKDQYNKDKTLLSLDVILAQVFHANEMGEGVLEQLNSTVNEWVEYYIKEKNSHMLTGFSSGLMWMGAYRQEVAVLQLMVANGLSMSPDMQQRLQFLSTSGGRGQKIHNHEILRNREVLSFDYSSLNWREEDFSVFFKTLAFQNGVLDYALTIREWSKTLITDKRILNLDTQSLVGFIGDMLEEEYGDSVRCQYKKCAILLPDSHEEIEGVLLTSADSRAGLSSMGLLLNIIQFGKNINIRLYTLFLPVAGTTDNQRMEAQSLKTNVNPKIVAFEEGLRESVLNVIQTIINSSKSDSGQPSPPPQQGQQQNNEKVY